MRRLFRATAPAIFCCAVPIHAQQQPPSGSAAVAIAPVQGQVFLESDPRIESVRPVQPQVGPKNDRLFFIIPNYLTVENRDQGEPLSAKTKFKLSAKTMSDPVTISFIGVIALIGQARNSDPS